MPAHAYIAGESSNKNWGAGYDINWSGPIYHLLGWWLDFKWPDTAVGLRNGGDTHGTLALLGHDRDWWTRGNISPTESLIGTSCTTERGEPFCIAIAAEKAIMIGRNPGWPCTDISLLFGDVLPGNTSAVRGKIYFRKGKPEKVLESYRQDFG